MALRSTAKWGWVDCLDALFVKLLVRVCMAPIQREGCLQLDASNKGPEVKISLGGSWVIGKPCPF